MGKIIWGLIKFYFVYMAFGVLAIIILYASADLKCLITTGESFIRTMIHSPESIDDAEAMMAITDYFRIAIDSVPCDTYFESVLGISLDNSVNVDIIGLVIKLIESGEAGTVMVEKFKGYTLFLRDMSVATCASMVLYAVAHLKSKLAGKSFSVMLGFALASIFWIFAGYTFGESLTFALEQRVGADNRSVLYVIIIITAIALESIIHSYGGKCSAFKLIILLCLKLFFNLLKCVFAWYMCTILTLSLGAGGAGAIGFMSDGIINMMLSAGLIVCISLLESKLTQWAERVRA